MVSQYQISDKDRIAAFEKYSKNELAQFLGKYELEYIDTTAEMINNNSSVVFTHFFRKDYKFLEFTGYIHLKKNGNLDIGYIVSVGLTNKNNFKYYDSGVYSLDNPSIQKALEAGNSKNSDIGYINKPLEYELLTDFAKKDIESNLHSIKEFIDLVLSENDIAYAESLVQSEGQPKLRYSGPATKYASWIKILASIAILIFFIRKANSRIFL